jgi:hypothetical protein
MNPIVKNPHFYFNSFLETKIILKIQPLALPPAPITRKKNNFFLLPHFEKKSAHEGGKIFFFFFFFCELGLMLATSLDA